MEKILVMESGSLREGYEVAGAVNAAFQLYNYLKSYPDYDTDFFADFSKISPELISVQKDAMMAKEYDIIFMNSIRDAVIVEKYAAKHKNTKVVYTDRGNVLANMKEAGMKALLPKMIARSNLISSMKKYLSAYVAITADQELYAKDYFPDKVGVYYVPIAPDPIFKRLNIEKSYKGAIYVGRLDERQKKLDFMIRGLEKVKDIHSDIEDELLLKIFGTGPDKARYEGLVGDLDLEENVEFMGVVTGEDLVMEYNNSGFFVSTSEWESPGRTFLEAMACGLPLLINTSNNALMKSSPKEYLGKDGYNALVYKYEDLEDFEMKFYALYSDKNLRDELSLNALTYMREFSLDKNQTKYKEIIDAMLK